MEMNLLSQSYSVEEVSSQNLMDMVAGMEPEEGDDEDIVLSK